MSTLVNSLRAALAIVVGIVILASTSLLVLLLSPLALLQRFGIQNPVPFICGWGFRFFDLIALRFILDLYVRCHDGTGVYKVEQAKSGEVVVIIANHPLLSVIFATPSLVWDHGLHGCAAVIKDEFVRQPWLAWLGIPATLAGFALPIRREKRDEALQNLEHGARRLPFGDRPFGVIIFPDGSRPTRQKIAASWKRYDQKHGNPWHYSPFTETLVPTALGLGQLLGGLRETGRTIRVIDLTIGFSRPLPEGLWGQLTAMAGAVLIVNRADVTREIDACHTRDELSAFLMRLWAAKNRKLKEWAQS